MIINNISNLDRMILIGTRLSAEKDIDKLMEMILEESMQITNSDGGSLYIITKEDEPKLQFKYTRNTSKDFPFNSFTMPLTKTSISGYTACTGYTCNLANMDETKEKIGIEYNDSFDKQNNYQTINMLVIPMKNLENKVIGVMQLINKKTDYNFVFEQDDDYLSHTEPYTEEEEKIISSLASQTAVLLERNILHEEIERLVKTFIESLVMALDQRDPITAGHSMRLAQYSLALCKAVNEKDDGVYQDTFFDEKQLKEVYYAALLHDIGKIGVREDILLKRNRLSDDAIEAIKYRMYFHYLNKKDVSEKLSDFESYYVNNISDSISEIESINKVGYLPDEKLEFLNKIKSLNFTDLEGTIKPLLSDEEYDNLAVRRGNLTEEQRLLIQEHPAFSFKVLNEISWSSELDQVPMIASSHHEKLSGKGYPLGLTADDISVQARILAIADIYDALTAKDRPYKPALSIERSISILQEECDRNSLDLDLFNIFKEYKVYNVVAKNEILQ